MEPPKKSMVFTKINQKDLSSINSELFAAFYTENARKKVNILKTLNLKTILKNFIYKNSIFNFTPTWPDSLKIVLFGMNRHFKKCRKDDDLGMAQTRK